MVMEEELLMRLGGVFLSLVKTPGTRREEAPS